MRLLKFILRIACRLYFNKIDIKGLENLDKNAPLLITPNHPSGWMDPILIAVFLNRKVHFIARGESFQTRMQRFVLGALNIIPVYRPDKTAHLTYKNKSIFNRCHEILAKGGAIIIFPEGLSKTSPQLGPFKTGAARIALGAESSYNFELGVKIIPIGLNYSNPHKYRTHVEINIGDAIPVIEYEAEYKLQAIETAKSLTHRIKTTVADLSCDIHDASRFSLYDELKKVNDCSIIHTTNKIDLSAINKLDLKDLNSLAALSLRFNYLAKMYAIDDASKNSKSIKNIELKHVATLPAYLVFWPALKITGIVTDLVISRPDFRGSMLVSLGILFFLINLAGIALLVSLITSSIPIAFSVSIISLMLFALNLSYQSEKAQMSKKKRYALMLKNEHEVVSELASIKNNIAIIFQKSDSGSVSEQA